jgi:tRNA uridine 5-carboxymethylaminomethyl modification enzyme
MKRYETDIVVVGGGHAGCEAAWTAARLGARVILITISESNIGQLSCNPAIGGVGKSHLVKEIDALDGAMGVVTDACGLQFRTLNASRGPAVRATRVQVDNALYPQKMLAFLQQIDNLQIVSGEVADIVCDIQGRCCGVRTADGNEIRAGSVICTTGTFLNGQCFIGQESWAGGRFGDKPATFLSSALRRLGIELRRFKTGTTPRLDCDSIDWQALEIQEGETPPPLMSFMSRNAELPQRACYLTYTSPVSHRIAEEHIHESPLYQGVIVGRGPRYCPSLEDKIMRFRDKSRHTIFLEPESLTRPHIYANGLSTCLPRDVQDKFLRSLPGLERVKVLRYGYAVEYDYSPPTQLDKRLMVRCVPGLFLAGQINGTSGYEEAAAQGLWAGLQAVRFVDGQAPLFLTRAQSYIGVLVDDLVTKGVDEPYRMFTSRAEYRLTLRETNAEERLAAWGQQAGLLTSERWAAAEQRRTVRDELRGFLQARASTTWAAQMGARAGETLWQFLRRPETKLSTILEEVRPEHGYEAHTISAIDEEIKYQGYIEREAKDVARLAQWETLPLCIDFDYTRVPGLSQELQEKLQACRPANMMDASRISGMTPAALTLIAGMARAPQASVSRET